MAEKNVYLRIGLGLSFLLHCLIFQSFILMGDVPKKNVTKRSSLVAVKVSPPRQVMKKKEIKKKPEPIVKKKKPIKITKITKVSPVPLSHNRQEEKEVTKPEDVKPVFGVTKKTVSETSDSGVSVRVGNTLMKEQEEEYTPPEKVKNYITVPSFELSTMPIIKYQVSPEYPDKLRDEELEGEVILEVTVGENGKVLDVKVKKTDHEQFSREAVKAMKKSIFTPATQAGNKVSTIIDYTFKFVLDD